MKKSKMSKPKPRQVWTINPESRVEKSKKIYSRPEEKKQLKSAVNWFGEE